MMKVKLACFELRAEREVASTAEALHQRRLVQNLGYRTLVAGLTALYAHWEIVNSR